MDFAVLFAQWILDFIDKSIMSKAEANNEVDTVKEEAVWRGVIAREQLAASQWKAKWGFYKGVSHS